MQAIADVSKHWAGTPTWGQFLDTCHRWHHYKDSHAADLVSHTIDHQLQLAQQAANDENHLQCKAWLQQGYTKVAWERPYRNLPPDERMTQRLKDWGQTLARQQGQQLEPLTFSQLSWALRHLPDKACGPDAVTAQLLRTAPPLAVKALLKLYQIWRRRSSCPPSNKCTWS